MFTGIIEELGEVVKLEREQGNVHLYVRASFISEIKIDQSIAHNGVCLTVVEISDDYYKVTAIKETLDRSNIGLLAVGDKVNLERCMQLGARLDGHIVQGHVDQLATCISVANKEGSWEYRFQYEPTNVTVEKGSVTVNGVSLTVVDSLSGEFSVAIIPYTQEHTNFHTFKAGSKVNLEFDIVGKYVQRLYEARGN